MRYHILGEHPELRRLLTGGWYSLAACRLNLKSLREQASPNRTWRIVHCLSPAGIDCGCIAENTFVEEE